VKFEVILLFLFFVDDIEFVFLEEVEKVEKSFVSDDLKVREWVEVAIVCVLVWCGYLGYGFVDEIFESLLKVVCYERDYVFDLVDENGWEVVVFYLLGCFI